MQQIGALSIGESPRPDLLAEITGCIAPQRIRQWGALDGRTREDIQREEYQVPLITRLRGATVLVERSWVAQRLQTFIDAHHREVDAFVVLCAEDFSMLRSPVPLFIPYLLARSALEAVGFRGRLGVVCPVAGQVASAQAKWSGWPSQVEVASPFVPGELDQAMARLAGQGAQLVLLDCTSFGQNDAQHLSTAYGMSVVAVRSLTWALVAQLAAQG